MSVKRNFRSKWHLIGSVAIYLFFLSITFLFGLDGSDEGGAAVALLIVAGLIFGYYVIWGYKNKFNLRGYFILNILVLVGLGSVIGSITSGEEGIDAVIGVIIAVGANVLVRVTINEFSEIKGLTKKSKLTAVPDKQQARVKALTFLESLFKLPYKLKGTVTFLKQEDVFCYRQKGIETHENYIQSMRRLLRLLEQAYPNIVSLGGEAVPYLMRIVNQKYNGLRPIAVDLLHEIATETKRAFSAQSSQLVCPLCYMYCGEHEIKLSHVSTINYYGCRACGQSEAFLTWAGDIVAVLDRNSTVTEEKNVEKGLLFINWFRHRYVFDFKAIEIRAARDEDVERFIMQLGNESDAIQKKRYETMSCVILPSCKLSENTMRILEDFFAEVILIGLTQLRPDRFD